MAKFNRRVVVDVDESYSPGERRAITRDVVDFIRKRTSEGKDKNGKNFKEYSTKYSKSTTYKEAGKKGKPVNLYLSGDMMAELTSLQGSVGSIAFGYAAGSEELGKVEGNVLGTYGSKKANASKARDFMGISEGDMTTILNRYPLDDKESSEARASLINTIVGMSKAEAKEQGARMIAAGTLSAEVVEEILEREL